MAILRSLGGSPVTTRLPMRISPAVISSSPASKRRAVLLPEPDGPTRTKNSLSRICKDRSLTAMASPKRLLTCSNVTLLMSSAFRYKNYLFYLTPQLLGPPPLPPPHHLPISEAFRHTRHCRHTKTDRYLCTPPYVLVCT